MMAVNLANAKSTVTSFSATTSVGPAPYTLRPCSIRAASGALS
jgi:hypothetical protein